jgi:ribosome-associated translation inhibitor RaiA
VIFDEEKNSKKIEGILHIDQRDPIVATGRGNDFNEALSQVNDRLGRQLRKLQKQVTDHRAPPLTEALSEE